MKKFFSDFKKFISRGNVIDLAIAVIIGAAFSKIVTSLVNDIIMPLIGLATGGASVSDLKWVIRPAVYDINNVLITAENALRYGVFFQMIIDFLIISFCVFVMFRIINSSSKKIEKLKQELLEKIQKQNESEEDESESDKNVKKEVVKVLTDAQRNELLLTEIRDLLKSQILKDKTKSEKVFKDEV